MWRKVLNVPKEEVKRDLAEEVSIWTDTIEALVELLIQHGVITRREWERQLKSYVGSR